MLSLKWFITALEGVFKNLVWNTKERVPVGGDSITLDNTDDVVVTADNFDGLKILWKN